MEEVVSMDRRTRKILAENGGLHTRSNIVQLYLLRKVRGEGLVSTEECIRKENKSLYG